MNQQNEWPDFSELPQRKPAYNALTGVTLGIGVFLFVAISEHTLVTWAGVSLLIIGNIAYHYYHVKRYLNGGDPMILFAERHGLAYQQRAKPSEQTGAIFNIGDQNQMQDIFTWTIDDTPIAAYQYSYYAGTQKYGRTKRYSVIEAELDKSLPHILLDNKRNDVFGDQSIERWLDDEYSFELEGDFNTYFKLYTAFPKRADALAILTPDVMQGLIAYAPHSDIEIVENTIRIFTPGINPRHDYQVLTQAMQHFLVNSDSNITHYRHDSTQLPNRKYVALNKFYGRKLLKNEVLILIFFVLSLLLFILTPYFSEF